MRDTTYCPSHIVHGVDGANLSDAGWNYTVDGEGDWVIECADRRAGANCEVRVACVQCTACGSRGVVLKCRVCLHLLRLFHALCAQVKCANDFLLETALAVCEPVQSETAPAPSPHSFQVRCGFAACSVDLTAGPSSLSLPCLAGNTAQTRLTSCVGWCCCLLLFLVLFAFLDTRILALAHLRRGHGHLLRPACGW